MAPAWPATVALLVSGAGALTRVPGKWKHFLAWLSSPPLKLIFYPPPVCSCPENAATWSLKNQVFALTGKEIKSCELCYVASRQAALLMASVLEAMLTQHLLRAQRAFWP